MITQKRAKEQINKETNNNYDAFNEQVLPLYSDMM